MDLGSAKFSGDGTHLLLATREKTLHVFDVESGEEVGTFEPPKPFDEYALSPDSRLLAMIGKTNTQQPNADPASHRSLLQLRTYTGKEVIWQREVPGSFSGELRFSPEAHFVAASLYGESQATKSKRWISVYSAETGEETYRIEDFPQNSNHFQFSPDGRHLAASYTDSSVLVWDLEQFRVD